MSINRKVFLSAILAISLITVGLVGLYYSRFSNSFAGSLFLPINGTGVLYQDSCQSTVNKTKICQITIMSKTESHAVARVHYRYIKGPEDRNRLFIVANKGKFDNTIGVGTAYGLSEGDNSVDVIFGLFRPDKYTKEHPYITEYFTLEVRGIDVKANIYISPSLINITTKYHHSWYSKDDQQ